MRDWTKAMAALLAAVATVGIVQVISAQEAVTTQPAVPAQPAAPAVKADEAETDPFAKAAMPNAQKKGQDLTKAELNVSDTGTVEIHVRDASIIDVLRTLSVQTKKNIVTSKSVTGTVTANLYNVTVREALDAILHANNYAYREKGNFIYVYTADELKKIEKDERKTTTQVFRLNYTPAAVMKDLIAPALSPDATVQMTKASTVGLPTSATEAGGNALATDDAIVVRDYEDNVAAVKTLVKDLDRRPQQVLVEATILDAELTDTNSLGIDFTLLGGVDFSSVGSTNSAVLARNEVGADTGTFDPVTGHANIDPKTPGSAFAENGYNAWGTNVKPKGNPQGLNIGIAYNNIGFFLNALEQVTDTNVLANPKVLTLNKQAGAVLVGRRDGYITTTTTSTTSQQTVEFLESGTRLVFRPFISDDGYIRMEIHPEDSTGIVEEKGAFVVPRTTTTELTTNVLVKDGHTIVIGGLFRENTTINRTQVPLLGDIPLAGYLFRSQTDTARKREVIVLLTPHIIKDHEMYSDASAEMMKYTEMVRAGIRKGMMPWGRDRLAEMSYQRARTEMSQKFYDRERAMWYLDCATNLSPAFPEALAAKQQVSGELIMETDGSSIRDFVADRIREEKVSSTPVEPVAPVVTPAPAAPATAPAAQ